LNKNDPRMIRETLGLSNANASASRRLAEAQAAEERRVAERRRAAESAERRRVAELERKKGAAAVLLKKYRGKKAVQEATRKLRLLKHLREQKGQVSRENQSIAKPPPKVGAWYTRRKGPPIKKNISRPHPPIELPVLSPLPPPPASPESNTSPELFGEEPIAPVKHARNTVPSQKGFVGHIEKAGEHNCDKICEKIHQGNFSQVIESLKDPDYFRCFLQCMNESQSFINSGGKVIPFEQLKELYTTLQEAAGDRIRNLPGFKEGNETPKLTGVKESAIQSINRTLIIMKDAILAGRPASNFKGNTANDRTGIHICITAFARTVSMVPPDGNYFDVNVSGDGMFLQILPLLLCHLMNPSNMIHIQGLVMVFCDFHVLDLKEFLMFHP
jgi:hypothetical protein